MNEGFIDLGDRIEMTVKFLHPGMVLACPVYTKGGEILLPPYTPFTKESLENWQKAGIEKIYYSKKSRDAQTLYTRNLKEYLEKSVYKGPRSVKLETQKKAVVVMDKIVYTVKNSLPVDFIEDTKEIISCVLKDIQGSNAEIINLLDIQSFDDDIYSHSLNVGTIAMLFARKRGMNEHTIRDIGIGSFLHDVGKIRIPYDITHKRDQLNAEEYELMKKHSRYGYEIVKESVDLNESIKKIILLHHERVNGTGYPFGFKDDQIDEMVQIVALSEIYDALTTEYSYKKAFSPQKAFNLIIRYSGHYFRADLAHQFVKDMNNLYKESNYYSVGNYVLLNTNEIAKVVSKDHELTSRPGIEIIKNQFGKNLNRPLHIDLNLDNSRDIIRIMDYTSN
ncbi:MAG: HD-GYP domain-containing protein [Spirochaetota bacterium]|nr:HD-GYP domain-containing protein [Spirochaetota bacterium]